jgi:hypothetical protein
MPMLQREKNAVDPSHLLLLPMQIINISLGEIGKCQLCKDFFAPQT